MYVRSFLMVTTHIQNRIIDQRKKKLNMKFIGRLNIILKRLILYLLGYDDDEEFISEFDLSKIEAEPILKRQMIVRDYGLLDHLIELCALPYNLTGIALSMRSQAITTLRESLCLNYDCIRHAIAEYRPNELFCSQWLGLFIDDTFKNVSDNIDSVEATLKELIDNNRKILEDRITDDIIKKFIKYITREPEAKYIELLNVLILCNGEPIPMNQKRVTKILFGNLDFKSKILVFIDKMSNKDKILLTINNNDDYQKVPIEKLKVNSQNNDSGKIYNYVLKLIEFLSNLCYGQNYSAIYELRKIYDLKSCVNIISSGILHEQEEIKAAFAKLVGRLWTSTGQAHQSYLKRFYCKIWSDIRPKEKVRIGDEFVIKHRRELKALWSSIKDNFKSLNNKANFNNYEKMNFNFVLSLLELSKDLLQNDIISADDEIEELRREVCKMLSSMFNYSKKNKDTDPKSKALFRFFKKRPEMKGPFNQCKLKLIEIYRIILNFDFNQFIDSLLFSLKDKNKLGGQVVNQNAPMLKDSKPKATFDMQSLIEKIKVKEEKGSIVKDIEEFVKVKEEEEEVVNCLLASSLESKEDLKIKSLDLLLSLFSKNEGLEDFIKRLILIESGKESRMFSKLLITTNKLEKSKEQFESNFMNTQQEYKNFKQIIDALMQEVTKKFEKKNEYAEILNSFEETDRFYEILKVRLINKFAQPTRLFQYLNHSLHVVELLIDILKVDKLTDMELRNMTPEKEQIFKKFFDYLRLTSTNNDLIKNSVFEKIRNLFKLDITHTSFFPSYLYFLDEWAVNNDDILKDQEIVKEIAKNILDYLLKSGSSEDPLNIFAMSILRKLIVTERAVFKENQNIIITMIFSQKYESLFSNFFGEKLKTHISEFEGTRQKFTTIKRTGSLKISITHPKIRFLSQYFLAVNACIAEKNKFTENFCQNLYSPQILFDIIKKPKLAKEDIVLMHSVTEYILESFILTDVCHKVSQIFIIQEVLQYLTIEFKQKIQTLLDESEDFYEMCDVIIVDERGCKRYQDVLEDYLILLSKLFYYVVQLDLPELTCEKFAKKFEQFLDNLLKILKGKTKKFGSVLKENFIKLIRAIADMKIVNNVGLSQKKQARMILQGFNLDDTGLRRKTMSFHNQKTLGNEYSLQPISNQLLSIIKGDKVMQHFEDQFENICMKLSSTGAGKKNSSSLEFVGVDLLKTLINKEDSDKTYPRLFVFCLRLIRYYINGSEKKKDLSESLQKAQKENNDRDLKNRQNRLVDQDLVSILIDIIIKVKEDSVINETFLLMISLLEGGNTQVQQELSSCLMQLESNDFHAKMMELIQSETRQLSRLNISLRERKLKNWFKLPGITDPDEEEFNEEEEQETITRHTSYTIKYFQVLQLFCEGHFRDLQNLLREQPEHQCKKSYNFYNISVVVYGSLIKYLNRQTTDLIIQVLNFLIEAVQGPNKLNQEFLFKSKFFEFLKDYLNEYYDNKEIFEDEAKSGLIEEIIKKSINLVSGMLEGNTRRPELHEEIYKHIKIGPLMKMLGNRFTKYWKNLDGYLKNPKLDVKYLKGFFIHNVFDLRMQEMFQTFFFIKYQVDTLKHHYPDFWENLEQEDQRDAYNFFEENSGSVELIFNNELELVYFIKQPASRFINKKEKVNFTNFVDRSSERNKLTDLLYRSRRLIVLMDYNMFVERTGNSFIKISKVISTRIDTIILIYAFIVNIMMLFLDRHEAEGNWGLPEDYWTFVVSRFIMFLLCLTRVAVSIAVDAPLVLMEGWTRIFSEYRKFFISRRDVKFEKEEEEKEKNEIIHLINKDIRSIQRHERLKVIEYVRRLQGYGETFTSFFYFMKCWEILASNFIIKYYIYTLGLSVLSIYYQLNIFFSLQLLDIIKQFEPLRNVIKSVTKNKKQLWLTSVLFIIANFISAEFGFFYVQADFYMSNIFPNGAGTCRSMYQCFLTVFSLCMRSSGGIGDTMTRESYDLENRQHYFVRFTYDYLSFIFINIILLNIFFGIILDTFSELRDERKMIDEDIKNKCFICGKERFYFDRLAQGFEAHIKNDHNIWSYIRFIYYIKTKDPTDYNGIESYINSKLQKESLDWFPRNQALCLENSEVKKDDKSVDDLMLALQNLNKSIETKEQIQFDKGDVINSVVA